MKQYGTAAIVSLVIAALGVLIYLLAVSGLLFGEATRWNDPGLWSVTIVLIGVGLLGFWAATAEKRQREEDAR